MRSYPAQLFGKTCLFAIYTAQRETKSQAGLFSMYLQLKRNSYERSVVIRPLESFQ
jgi:hypothetical protein